jgi:hypothetical protein
MLRLVLFILVLGIVNTRGKAEEKLCTTCEFSPFSQSGPSLELNSYNQSNYCDGIIGSSGYESTFFPDLRKNLFSEYQIIDEIKSNGFYFTDANLFFLIRKDNLFLSILRI